MGSREKGAAARGGSGYFFFFGFLTSRFGAFLFAM
jgi:hypothetical protein